MAEKKNSNSTGSGVLKKRNPDTTGKKSKVKTAGNTQRIDTSSVNNAELQKTKEIKTITARTAVKDKEAEKKIEKAASGNTGKTVKTRKPKKEKLGINWFFWIMLILIIIPVFYFVKLLHDASLEGNVPVLGERLKHNLQYVITDEQLTSMKGSIETIDGVEKYEVNLIVDTLRVTVDARDDMTADQLKEMTKSIYEIVNENAPVDKYFTQEDDFKQYDMEINAYNTLEVDEPVIVSLFRNSNMENYRLQVISNPVNKKVADALKEDMQKQLEEEERERQEAENQQNAEGENTENSENTKNSESEQNSNAG